MRRGSAFTPQGREILVLCRISVSAWQCNHCSSTLYLILQAAWYQEMPPSFVPKLTPPPNPFQCGMHGSYSSHFLHLLLDCLGCLRTKAHAPWPNFFFQFTLCSVPQVDSKQSKAWKKNHPSWSFCTFVNVALRLHTWNMVRFVLFSRTQAGRNPSISRSSAFGLSRPMKTTTALVDSEKECWSDRTMKSRQVSLDAECSSSAVLSNSSTRKDDLSGHLHPKLPKSVHDKLLTEW